MVKGKTSQFLVLVSFIAYQSWNLFLLSSRSPPAFNLSQHQGLFKSVSSLHQVAKVLEFHLHPSVFPTNIQGWFPLGLTGWITSQSKRLKSLLQQRSSKASILPCSALFIVQLLHPYMTAEKTIALTRWTFVGKWCLCFLICHRGWS